MTPQHPRISVIDPITPAIDRVKVMLFKPFELRKWFVIGFCAWLAYLGQGGSGGGGSNFHVPTEHDQAGFQHAKDFVIDNLPWLIPTAIIGVILMIVIWLIITWLSSRGKFMFLHCVAQNKAEVKIPWTQFRNHANSLFVFRIVLAVLGLVVFFIIGLLGVLAFIPLAHADITPLAVLVLIFFVLLFFAAVIIISVVAKFTYDFVVPFMFIHAERCTTAWRRFLTLLSANKGRFALYILFQILISFVIGAIIMTVCLVGLCLCCASLLLCIPYIGTVILLPLFIFKRAYSLIYLRQFGHDCDVFIPQAEPQP